MAISTPHNPFTHTWCCPAWHAIPPAPSQAFSFDPWLASFISLSPSLPPEGSTSTTSPQLLELSRSSSNSSSLSQFSSVFNQGAPNAASSFSCMALRWRSIVRCMASMIPTWCTVVTTMALLVLKMNHALGCWSIMSGLGRLWTGMVGPGKKPPLFRDDLRRVFIALLSVSPLSLPAALPRSSPLQGI